MKRKQSQSEDKKEIESIANRFFDLFTNTENRIQDINELFLSDGLLINKTLEEAKIYTLESFIEPREKILTNGTLTDFVEKETNQKTEIYGKIAQRSCDYEKSGILNGKPFNGKGKKLMQFIKLQNRWILSSVVWSDKTE